MNYLTRVKANTTRLATTICITASLTTPNAIANNAPQLGKSPLNDVISALTLQEKVLIVTGSGMDFPGLPPSMQGPVVGIVSDGVAGAAGTTHAVPRLGIPSIVLADGPAGLRIQPMREGDKKTYYATAFPIATLLASSWDTELVSSVGAAMGNEVKEYGVDVLLAPALNIQRYALGGRNFEYYSEDPLVSGKMAAAMTRGIQSQGVGTSIKHFAANNHEWNRNVIDVKVDERALREIYLKGFEITVKESAPWTVMSSYNKINGTYTSESHRLLTDILRTQWGFNGLVMTDWFGGKNAVAQMQSGNDLLMPGTQIQLQTLMDAVKNGALDEKILDRNVAAILNIVVQTPTFKKYNNSDKPDLVAHAKVARTAAAEGMVLLRNQKASLPLIAKSSVALFGNSAYNMVTGGTGSGDVNEAYSVSLLTGLTDAGFVIDKKLQSNYENYLTAQRKSQPPAMPFMLPPPIPENTLSLDVINAAATNTDSALITIGRNSGEFVDRKQDDDFYLSKAEQQLIENVTKAFHQQKKKVVVVLNIGGVIETASWRDKVDGILLAWQPGQEAGHAVADVLSGKVNPSGKITATFPLKLNDYPAAENFPGVVLEAADPGTYNPMLGDKAASVEYKDSIWVGYRHFNTKGVKTAYSFGYGLSYTEFKYSALKLSKPSVDGELTVTVTIKNSGKVAGKEVAQLYVSAPEGKLEKPSAELRAFAKTKLLQPGESQTLTFVIAEKDLTSFDVSQNNWLVDAGKYTVKIGASSTDIKLTKTFKKKNESRIAL
ncbi:MAG: glycoside hydrolase family 3 C-terminal domain-containing protein [Cellvibrio sp.]|uniref:glycoside hydrolase family 3 C-terminal domain-containing protein n=1 Tax=Cellvibrio sp. TaxID=1965322 RepID=UPI0031A96FC6